MYFVLLNVKLNPKLKNSKFDNPVESAYISLGGSKVIIVEGGRLHLLLNQFFWSQVIPRLGKLPPLGLI